ncbi:glycosyltransferase family 39 protein [Patescibacteria group bacterium]|nr:glycosyltransferase family 39 protein [Patescibacteria group bacterium]
MAKKVIFWVVLVFGFCLRILFLETHPVGIHSQEAIVGYRAYALLSTGKDELGRKTPLVFISFENYQLPVQTYLTVLSTMIFGSKPLAVRFPGVFFGTLAILAIYGIAKQLFDQKVALWSAFLAAASPWSVFLSRVAFPEGLSFSFFAVGIYFLLKSKKNTLSVIFSIIALLLSLYCSQTAWFVIFPLLTYLLFWDKNIFTSKKQIRIILLTCFILFLPLLGIYLRLPSAKQSLIDNNLSLFTDIGILNGINAMRGDELRMGTPLFGKIFFNKLFWLAKITERVLGHFSPYFYFAKGEQNPLHGLWNFGPMFLVLIFPFISGLLIIVKKPNYPQKLFLFWFLIVATVSGLLKKSPDLSRLIFGSPLIFIIISLGLVNFSRRLVNWVMIPLILVNFFFVFYDAAVKEPVRAQKVFYSDFEKIAQAVYFSYEQYDKVYLSDGYVPDPMPLFLFYTKFPPESYYQLRPAEPIRYRFWMSEVGNIFVGKFDRFESALGEKTVLFVTEDEINSRLADFHYPPKSKPIVGEACYQIEEKYSNLRDEPIIYRVTGNPKCILTP